MSIEWGNAEQRSRAAHMRSTERKFRVSRLRIVAAFVPLALYVLALLNYGFWIAKYRIGPSFPPYSDPISAVFGTVVLSLAGLLACGPLWLFGVRPRWVLVLGSGLCAILLTLAWVVLLAPLDFELFRPIRRFHFLGSAR